MTEKSSLPTLTPEGNLSRYLQNIRKYPLLTADEELEYSRLWRDKQDPEAAKKLITSHLRLVAKIAMGYRGYGLPVAELISEGNLGMMQAVKRFDPEKGFRLATYAIWWIRAAMQEYILHSWSLVKMGTTAAQKKLFFNLRKLKGQMNAYDEGDLRPDQVVKIAEILGVAEHEVLSMNQRLAAHDHSLNAPLKTSNEGEWQDWLVDGARTQEEVLGEEEEMASRRKLLREAMATLNERERDILFKRRLADEPETLEDLSLRYQVSRERIRQIEARALEKIQKFMENAVSRHRLEQGLPALAILEK